MIEYSHQNTLTFQFGETEALTPRTDPTAPLTYTMQRCTRNPGTFPEECVRTATLLGEKAKALQRRPYVLLSGGMDSEVVAKSMLEAGIRFTPITFRFANGLNSHEITYVEKFCARHNLAPMYFDIDPLQWYRTEHAYWLAVNSYCAVPIMLCHMRLMSAVWERMNGMPILGGGDVVIEKQANGEWHYSKFEYILSWYWHAQFNKIDGGIAFFQHTPEMTLSMLREPAIECTAIGQDEDANQLLDDCRFVKYGVYRKYWPDLELRPKFGGGEQIRPLTNRMQARLQSDRGDFTFNETWHVPYASFRESIEP